MTPEKGKTYIEKNKYWETNRVVICHYTSGDYVIGTIINLDTWQENSTRITIKEFQQRYELCEIQMRL